MLGYEHVIDYGELSRRSWRWVSGKNPGKRNGALRTGIFIRPPPRLFFKRAF
jgi:hypothetical protein